MSPRLTTLLLSLLSLTQLPAAEPLPDVVDFNEHVQPLLSEYCYHCHGPDSKTRLPEKAPLRLDLEEFAFEHRESLHGPVIVKGDPAKSALIRRMKSDDPDELMPPAKSHKIMKAEEIALLEKWVTQGAEYQDHWSFIAPTRPNLPKLPKELQAWTRNPIDSFVSEKLAAADLDPNPVEAPRRFLRRLTFDLTGLPPTPPELDSFETAWLQNQDNAVDAAITRLLQSPAYGEHYARHWLDAARYSDTHGIHIDNYRSIWPYRDWVINAFNKNMPFDQFTIEQIGGDLLPEPSLDQIVATGFNRCLATTGEGGAINEEYEAIYAQDRTDTTAAVWLGLTVGCAACHDHKFDPITQKDTYSFNAFFRNTTMSAMDGNKADHPPNIFVPLLAERGRMTQLQTEIELLDTQLKKRTAEGESDYQAWLTAAASAGLLPSPAAPDFHLPLSDLDQIVRGGPAGSPQEWPANFAHRAGPLGPAPIVSGPALPLGDYANLSAESAFSYGALVYIEGRPDGALISRMDTADNYRGWDLWLQKGQIGAHIIDQWEAQASKSISKNALKPQQWHHVMITFDPKRKASEAIAIYVDGTKQEVVVEQANLPAKNQINTKAPLVIGGRHGSGSVSPTSALQDFRLYHRLLSDAEITTLAEASSINTLLARAPGERTEADLQTIRNYYFASVDPSTIELAKQKAALSTELEATGKSGAVSLIMQEKPNSEAFAHILVRGEYSNQGDKVLADVPGILPDLPADAPRNRLGLGRWLVARENPLSARVTANRTWYYLFGRGIVETTEDFGIMGSRPTHPRLLDWLAVDFMEAGWDYQHLLRTILSSATYRQSQDISSVKLERDPLNELLSRGPRYRLDAEQIRDLALASSGLLINQVGGPSVHPYQPEGVWEAVAMKGSTTRNYKQDHGEALYRRSIYTIQKRTAPHPSMDIFNAPTREVFCVRRERTNTPLQAFVTMNDIQFVEAARHLAEEVLLTTPDQAARLDLIYKRLLARPPHEEELPVLQSTLQSFLDAYKAAPEEASLLITTGESPPHPTLAPPELAAWTLLTSNILNLDETLTK